MRFDACRRALTVRPPQHSHGMRETAGTGGRRSPGGRGRHARPRARTARCRRREAKASDGGSSRTSPHSRSTASESESVVGRGGRRRRPAALPGAPNRGSAIGFGEVDLRWPAHACPAQPTCTSRRGPTASTPAEERARPRAEPLGRPRPREREPRAVDRARCSDHAYRGSGLALRQSARRGAR